MNISRLRQAATSVSTGCIIATPVSVYLFDMTYENAARSLIGMLMGVLTLWVALRMQLETN